MTLRESSRDSIWLTCETNRTKTNRLDFDVKNRALNSLLDYLSVILCRPAATDLVFLDDAAFELLQLLPRLTHSGIKVSSFNAPLLNHKCSSSMIFLLIPTQVPIHDHFLFHLSPSILIIMRLSIACPLPPPSFPRGKWVGN